MSEPLSPNGTRWQLADHERRIKDLEGEKVDAKVDVLVERIGNLSGAVKTMQRTLVGFVATVAAGVAIAVILSGGGHP